MGNKGYGLSIFNLLFFLSCLLFSLCAFLTPGLRAEARGVVQTKSAAYTYAEMIGDIMELSEQAPGLLRYEVLGTTSQNRAVCLLTLGNPEAPKKVLVQASIHAREYMTTQLVMRMVEYYIDEYPSGGISGIAYRDLFDRVCFYILPMVNPDGVSLSQFGSAAASTPEAAALWGGLGHSTLVQIKSNAAGVDLNRNFPVGFGQSRPISYGPSLAYYPGPSPISETESKLMAALLEKHSFRLCINYHAQGRVLYFGRADNPPEVALAAAAFAAIIHNHTGYKLMSGNTPGGDGSFSDYFQAVENAPSVTLEIGTQVPVPISQFKRTFRENYQIWGVVAALIY